MFATDAIQVWIQHSSPRVNLIIVPSWRSSQNDPEPRVSLDIVFLVCPPWCIIQSEESDHTHTVARGLVDSIIFFIISAGVALIQAAGLR